MSKNFWYSSLIVINLLIVGVLFVRSVLVKEKILKDGQLVLLELAPVDPRSLMQGDYMNLSYAILREFPLKNLPSRGFALVQLNDQGVGNLFMVSKTLSDLSLVPIKFYRQDERYSIGAASFFFEEGQASVFDAAKYGGLRVDKEGNSVLVGLYDSTFQKIEPQARAED